MKAIFSLLLAASLGSAFAQCASPYNPDSDGDGVIGSSDLMGLLTTFGNPFCGYDSLNVQTVSDTSAVIDEDTDIIFVEAFDDYTVRNLHLPMGEGTKVLILFQGRRTPTPTQTAPSYNVEFFENDIKFSQINGGSLVMNLVRFNGTWYNSSVL